MCKRLYLFMHLCITCAGCVEKLHSQHLLPVRGSPLVEGLGLGPANSLEPILLMTLDVGAANLAGLMTVGETAEGRSGLTRELS